MTNTLILCRRRSVLPCLLWALLMLGLLTAKVLAAEAGAPLDDPARRLLEQERARQRDERLQRDMPDIQITTDPSKDDGSTPLNTREDGHTFQVQEIILQGNTLLSDQEIARVTTDFKEIPLGLNRINLLLKRLTALYLEKGYFTTRVYLGEQNLNSGQLVIDVVEGRLESLRYNGGPLPFGVRMAFPTGEGRILQLRDIEQGVDQLNRLRRNKATLSVEPGEQVGGSKINITNEQGDVRYYTLGLDNTGQKSSGRNRLRLGIDTEDMLGLQEMLTLSYTGSRDTNAVLFSTGIPYGYHTFSYTLSYSDYVSALGGYAQLYGDTYWHNLAWNYTSARSANSKSGFDVSLSHRRGRRFINDTALNPQRLSALRIAANQYRQTRWGSVLGEIAYSQGVSWLGADRDPPGLPNDAASTRFRKVNATLETSVLLNQNWNSRHNVSLQWSNRGLYGSEQMFFGGSSSVRGYEESITSGDHGVQLRNEFGYNNLSWLTGKGVRLLPYLFVDGGWAKVHGQKNQTLYSTGIGTRLLTQRLYGDFVVGVPLKKHEQNAGNDIRATFNIAYRY